MIGENGGTNMYMPVAPAYGYGNGGDGMFGGANGWWILLLLLICGNGWGMGGFGGGMWPMMMGGMAGMDYLYPWLNNSQHISDGFRDQQLQTSISGIQNSLTSGFGDVQLGIAGVNQNICQTGNGIQNALCQGFAGTTAAVTGAQNAIAQQLYGNEIASLNRSFAEQTANMQGFNGTHAGISDLKYTVATENCADRTAAAQNTRDIIDSQTRGTQAILDKLCALELDGVKGQLAQAQRENVGLQNQLNMANMAASQVAQTGNIRDAIIGELRSCPIPAQPVYGSQPIFTCPQNQNYGCGCNSFANGFAN